VSRGIACDLDAPTVNAAIGNSTAGKSTTDTSTGGSIASEAEIIERLQRLERLLETQRYGQTGNIQQAPSTKILNSPKYPAELLPSAVSPQIQDLANDVALLESIYTGPGFSVS
jgi:hypothetical protein